MSPVAVSIGLAAAVLSSVSAQGAIVNQWVQYGPNDTALIRAIEDTPTNGCPVASLDGVSIPLSQRGAVTTSVQSPQLYYPVLMCEASVSAFGHVSVTVNNVTLKMPVANPKRILVIGDTGCRVTASVASTQNCNDPTQFPLQYVSNYAATFKPDLIVHVGDFFYREQPCPAGFSGCAGNPVYDNWDSWNADWFGPAANLMSAAPMAISRGNHESCNRGAHGWFRLLDVHAFNQAAVDCTGTTAVPVGAPGMKGPLTPFDYTDPYVVNAGQVALLMFDSSISNTAGDSGMKSTDGRTVSQIFTAQLAAILPQIKNPNVFYVTHKPTYDVRLYGSTSGTLSGGDYTQQSVFDALSPGSVPSQIKLLVSGHDHQFQVVDFKSNYPPQLVVGNSGTLLDNQTGTQPQAFVPDTTGPNAGATYSLPGITGTPATTIQASTNRAEYGFTVLDATNYGYLVNTYNLSSTKTVRCAITMNPRSMLCAQ